jgi:hypothetical protein
MTLARDGTAPSAQEMKTCIGCLPSTIYRPIMEETHVVVHNNREALQITFAENQYVQPMFE